MENLKKRQATHTVKVSEHCNFYEGFHRNIYVSIYLARTVPEDIVGAASSENCLSCYLGILLEIVPWTIVGAVGMLLLEFLSWGSTELLPWDTVATVSMG